MRDWGFQDFGDIIGQGYDEITTSGGRFQAVFDGLVRNIAVVQTDPTEWVGRVREVSASNLAHASGGFLHAYHTRCEVPLLDALRRLFDWP